MSKTLATMSRKEGCALFPSPQIADVVNTTTHAQPVQGSKELGELTHTKNSKDMSEFSIQKEANFTADEVISALEKAHVSGCYSQYQSLLTAGLEVDRCLGIRCTAITYAVFQNDWKLVSRLLKSGANPDGCREPTLHTTPVEVAVSVGSLGIVRLLCEAGAELNSERSEVLQRAAQRGNAEMVALLLDYGARIDHVPSQQNLGWLGPSSTALHEACSSFSRAVIQVLISRGADIEKKDWAGKTVLERALEMGPDAGDIVLTLRNYLVHKVARRCDW